MNFEDKTMIFIQRYCCAMKFIEKNKLSPVIYPSNLTVRDLKFRLKEFAPGIRTSPIDVMADGIKLSTNIFGVQKDATAREYVGGEYPLMQIFESLLLNYNTSKKGFALAYSFYQGLDIHSIRVTSGYSGQDCAIMFLTARSLLNTFFNGRFEGIPLVPKLQNEL